MWVQGMGISLRDEKGFATRFIAALTDIAERRAQDEALRDQAALTRAIIDSNPNPIYLKDAECRFVDVNPAWERQTGIPSREACGRTVTDLFPSERSAVYDRQDRELLIRGEGSSIAEVEVRRDDGRQHHYIMSKSVLKWSDGRVRGLVGTLTDITALKEIEAALRASREEALSAGQAKAAFLATMSHEIRTPLNGVLGMANLLRDTPLDPEQRDYVDTILVSGDALLSVINDILDYSKIESGRMDLESEPLSLERVVEDSVEILAERAREKDVELAWEVGEGVPPWIAGDLARLRQVLVNLVGNAVKFTDAGEVVVAVRRTGAEEDGRVRLRFEVADTGIGIAPERLATLFEPFTQVDASTTRKYGGTGLGLAICRRLVRIMGGELEVTSQPGRGSVFFFEIPVMPAPAMEPAAQGPAPDIAGRRILIVDDHATNLRILSQQLKRWGAEPFAVPDGAAALESVAQKDFDAAVLDYHMPGMDGVKLARAIRATPRGKALPLVLLSSSMYRRAEEAERGLFASQLLKPARQKHLLAAISAAVAGTTFDSARTSRIRRPGRAAAAPTLGERLPLSILVADDVEVNRKLAVLMLKALGYESPQAVSTGAEAVQAATHRSFDLVLMDVQMPDMDGFEATRLIREKFGAKGPKVIAMTAFAMAGDRDRCLAAGMDDYLPKPFTPDTLREVIERVAGAGSAALAAQPAAAPSPAPQSPIDWTRIESLKPYDADGSLVREAIGAFLRDGPKYLAAMHEAFGASDGGAVASAAHALKGAAANVGARRLEAICREVEAQARDGTVGDAGETVAKSVLELDAAVRALKPLAA
jgi:PAS domain S-box-containing protein